MIDWKEYITTDPEIMYGKPIIKGTRIPVDLILEKLAYGGTVKDLLKAYPNIDRNAVNACLLFASDSIKNEKIHARAS